MEIKSLIIKLVYFCVKKNFLKEDCCDMKTSQIQLSCSTDENELKALIDH
jgi:hypothetical protein